MRQLAALNSSKVLNEVPIFTVDIIPIPALVEASDMLAINIHPFYRVDLKPSRDPEVMAERILQATIYQIDFYRNLAPHKEIVVTEIGWPTASAPTDVNQGDLEVSYRFLKVRSKSHQTSNSLCVCFPEICDLCWCFWHPVLLV